MGCNGCKPTREIADEEKLILQFEDSLAIQKLQVLAIDRIFHRYSSDNFMSTYQLEKAFSELNIDLANFQNFYFGFYEKFAYNLKKLKCLGILLGTETIHRKLKILFQNYDTETSGSLNRSQLSAMIDDLTDVACSIIPKFVLSINSENESLRIYVNNIVSVRKSLNRQLLASMIESKNIMSEREFNVSFQNDEGVRNILSTRAMREYCSYLKSNVLGSVDSIMKNLSSHQVQVKKILNFHAKPKKKKGIINTKIQ